MTLLLGSLILLMGYKIQLCDDLSSEDFISLILFFSRIVWIDKLHNLARFFTNKSCHGNGKNIFFSYRGNDSFLKNMKVIDIHYHWKNRVDWISSRQDKMLQHQKCTFWDTLFFTTIFHNRDWLSYEDG